MSVLLRVDLSSVSGLFTGSALSALPVAPPVSPLVSFCPLVLVSLTLFLSSAPVALPVSLLPEADLSFPALLPVSPVLLLDSGVLSAVLLVLTFVLLL